MLDFAQTTYYYTPTTTHSGISGTLIFIYLLFIVAYLVAGWKIFEKAGQAGWKVLIPIYNAVIQMRIVGLSGWYVLLYIIPIVNIVLAVVVAYRLAKSFGYGVGMTILEFVFGIGSLIIAFGDSKYLGPNGEGKKPAAPATE